MAAPPSLQTDPFLPLLSSQQETMIKVMGDNATLRLAVELGLSSMLVEILVELVPDEVNLYRYSSLL
jgi:hypothetical protein